jgi:hypothetical protein
MARPPAYYDGELLGARPYHSMPTHETEHRAVLKAQLAKQGSMRDRVHLLERACPYLQAGHVLAPLGVRRDRLRQHHLRSTEGNP